MYQLNLFDTYMPTDDRLPTPEELEASITFLENRTIPTIMKRRFYAYKDVDDQLHMRAIAAEYIVHEVPV
jgi:hypothetical protein